MAAVDLAFAAGWGTVRRLPEPVVTWLFNHVADQVVRRQGNGVRRLRSNLAAVRPDAGDAELDALTRAAMRSYLRYWQEAFRLPDWNDARIVGRVKTVNEKLLRDAHDAGRGVICALPHLANYDHAGAWAGRTGMPVSTIAERLRPESVYERFIAYRRKLGMEVLPLTGPGSEDAVAVLAERLRAGGFICLVADRDLSEKGVPVDFFGRTARMPAGPAALSVRTGAPLIPATLHYDGPDLVITFHDVVEKGPLATMTQQCADAFASGIAAHPQDWHMLQRVFLD
ncbi:phosphatidylinositol mannoside acyltransferase [Kribbella sp. NBC_01245]|uniref:phosphatidylinositol mannoside acyltransferase n=1 Tax=Kribbella sp. NBC_01245 TaxID=2903578 RepID=UPI002E28989A|nr:phosphatidylinositol mannoside acyltransferase [Kribbella sp. NBC_01245]